MVAASSVQLATIRRSHMTPGCDSRNKHFDFMGSGAGCALPSHVIGNADLPCIQSGPFIGQFEINDQRFPCGNSVGKATTEIDVPQRGHRKSPVEEYRRDHQTREGKKRIDLTHDGTTDDERQDEEVIPPFPRHRDSLAPPHVVPPLFLKTHSISIRLPPLVESWP